MSTLKPGIGGGESYKCGILNIISISTEFRDGDVAVERGELVVGVDEVSPDGVLGGVASAVADQDGGSLGDGGQPEQWRMKGCFCCSYSYRCCQVVLLRLQVSDAYFVAVAVASVVFVVVVAVAVVVVVADVVDADVAAAVVVVVAVVVTAAVVLVAVFFCCFCCYRELKMSLATLAAVADAVMLMLLLMLLMLILLLNTMWSMVSTVRGLNLTSRTRAGSGPQAPRTRR